MQKDDKRVILYATRLMFVEIEARLPDNEESGFNLSNAHDTIFVSNLSLCLLHSIFDFNKSFYKIIVYCKNTSCLYG